MLTSPDGPMTVLLIGGTSEIALSIASELAGRRTLRVVLASRPGRRRDEAQDRVSGWGCMAEVVDFDATTPERSIPLLRGVFERMSIDVAVVAQGVLPDQESLEADPAEVEQVCTINYTSAVATGLVLAQQMREQGHGVIVALSSVAGVRPRAANYVYGSTKAGSDAFYTGLRERLRGSGVRVLVVRPGHVHTRMTAGLTPAPFAVWPDHVAAAVVPHLARGNRTVWVPGVLAPVMGLVRVLPGALFRRLGPNDVSQRPLNHRRAL